MVPSNPHDHEVATVLCKLGQGPTQRLWVGRIADRTIEAVQASDRQASPPPSPTMWVRLLAMLVTVLHRKP